MAIRETGSEHTITLSNVSLEKEAAQKDFNLKITRPEDLVRSTSNTSPTNSEKRASVSIKYKASSIKMMAEKVNLDKEVINIQDFKN